MLVLQVKYKYMDNNKDLKKYPATTDEVAQLLGLKGPSQHLPMSSISTGDLPVANLPIAKDTDSHAHVSPDEHAKSENTASSIIPNHAEAVAHAEAEILSEAAVSQPKYLQIVKATLPFVGIFSVGLLMYYFFFTGVNFNSVFNNLEVKTQNAVNVPQETALEELKKQGLAGYNTWISGFYYSVSDTKITDPDTDNSGNGLSNFQKYLLNLNPKSYDTLGLGMSDTEAIAQGLNPLSGAPLTEKQKEIISKYFDMEVAMNRLTLSNMQNPGRVAGVNTDVEMGIRGPVVRKTAVTPTPSSFVSPKTGANVNQVQDQSVNVDTAIVGHLDIPSLNVAVPIMWSSDPKNFEKDLQTGVVHYPGTAIPGQVGTTYIAGHSSNFVWAKGNYNKVFSKLGDLKDNASFSVSVTDKNGKLVTYHYVVVSRHEYSPTDPAQIQNTGKSLVALSTCWPLNSTAKRLVVYGQLTQVEK